MKKGIIYARHLETRECEKTVEEQVKECEKFAKENNVQVIMTTCINEPFYESSNVVNL